MINGRLVNSLPQACSNDTQIPQLWSGRYRTRDTEWWRSV